jgi:hypothetical protein
LSSAILYLAIVAIWACVLVPRWLHRSHEAAPEGEVLADEAAAADRAEASDHGEYGAPTEPASSAEAYTDPALGGPEAQANSPACSNSPARSDSRTRSDFAAPADSGTRPDAAQASRHGPARAPAPAAGRARVLQVRRRMLTMLVALAVTAMACVVIGLTHWWTAVPPVGVLGMYLLLLHEAARADAEASMRAEAHARAQAARVANERAREARSRAGAARLPQPPAEIIDISDRTTRVSDQLYDQYADATVRAVGD